MGMGTVRLMCDCVVVSVLVKEVSVSCALPADQVFSPWSTQSDGDPVSCTHDFCVPNNVEVMWLLLNLIEDEPLLDGPSIDVLRSKSSAHTVSECIHSTGDAGEKFMTSSFHVLWCPWRWRVQYWQYMLLYRQSLRRCWFLLRHICHLKSRIRSWSLDIHFRLHFAILNIHWLRPRHSHCGMTVCSCHEVPLVREFLRGI